MRLLLLVPPAAALLLGLGRLVPGCGAAAVLGSWLLLGVAPGLCAWGFLAPGARPALGAAYALALGPVISLAPLAAGFSSGLPSDWAPIPAAILALVCALIAARRIAPGEPVDQEGSARRLIPWIAAIVVVLASLPLASAWWRVRSDAWFHAAFALQVRDFGIPPQDPFFAGMPLRYFWLFHLYLAGLSALSGASPFAYFALINIQAFAALALTLHLVSAAFRRDAASHRLVVLTGVLGLNAFLWLFVPAKALRAFIGNQTGPGELEAVFNQFPIEIIRWIDFLAPLDGAQPFFLSKFFVGSAFSIGFALGALLLLLGVRAFAGAPRREAALFGAALAGVWAFHPDVALFLGPACIAGAAAAALLGDRATRANVASLAPWGLAAALATILLTPYLVGIGAGKGMEDLLFFLPDPRRAAAIAATGAAFLLLAPLALRDLARSRPPSGRFLAVAGLALSLLALGIRLPGSERAQTMDKNPYFLALGLCVPAGWALADLLARIESGRRGKMLRVWAAAALLVPANAAMLFGYLLGGGRFAVGPDERALVEWIRRETPREAVFLESRAVPYNDRMRLPVLGPRRVFCGAEQLAREWHYPAEEIGRRAALEEGFFSRGDPTGGGTVIPDVHGGPAYLLWISGPGGESDPLNGRFPLLFASGPYRVHGVGPPGQGVPRQSAGAPGLDAPATPE